MTSVGEVVIARAHVTVLPRLRNAETRRVAGGWSVVQLILQVGRITAVTPRVQVKIQLFRAENISPVNHFKRQAGASCWFERTASFLYPTHVCSVRTFKVTKKAFQGKCLVARLCTENLERKLKQVLNANKGEH